MTATADTLTLTRPDDWHLHLRDGPATGRSGRGDGPRVRTCNRHAKPEAAGHDGCAPPRAYRDRILAALPPGPPSSP